MFLSKLTSPGNTFIDKGTALINFFTRDGDPRYEDNEKVRGSVKWCTMQAKDFFSKISFELENENGNLVSFNGQSIASRISVKEISLVSRVLNARDSNKITL